MLQVNNEWVYEDLNEENMIELLETFRRGEVPKRGPQIDRNGCEGPEGRTSLKDFDQGKAIHVRDFAGAKAEWEANNAK